MHAPMPTSTAPSAPEGARLPRLYTFRRCPYAMRARMALLQAGRAFEAVEVSLRDKPASLLALSPKATVPVLQLGLPDEFVEHGDPVKLMSLCGLDAAGIEASIVKRFGAKPVVVRSASH